MTWYDAQFGSTKTGLGTVGVTEYDATGSISVARATAGVVELAGGGYGRDWTVDPTTVTLVWDTGEATPKYAQESIVNSSLLATISAAATFIIKLLRNRRITDPDTGIQTVYDDDNSTPLVSGAIWEDNAGTVAYSATSDGIDRQDRMV